MGQNTLNVRAAVFHGGTDGAISVEQMGLQYPRAGEVLIRIKAAGVCGSDRHVLDGDWEIALPAVLGHEGAGIVERIGPGVTGLRVGDHVAIAWHQGCQRCGLCASGKPWACLNAMSNQSLLPDQSTRWTDSGGKPAFPYLATGSLSEAVVVPEHAAIKLDAAVPFEIASLIGCAVGTGFGAVANNAQVRPGESSLVIGVGGVGLAIVAALKYAGAYPIIAADIDDEKLDQALALGASHAVRSGPNLLEAVTAICPGGVDAGFEAIGLRQTMEQLPLALHGGGRGVFVGLPPEGAPISLDVLHLCFEGRSLIGSNYGGLVPQRDFPRIAGAYLSGGLPLGDLISSRVQLDDVEEAFGALRRGQLGRTVVTFD